MDGQLLGTKSDPMCATLGPKRARHAWCARCATCSTCGNILGHMCGPREHLPKGFTWVVCAIPIVVGGVGCAPRKGLQRVYMAWLRRPH